MKYEGEIHEINLVEHLIQLWRDRFTGAIRFESDGITKIIYFKGGDVLSASTNDRADSVDEILMRAGKVSKEHVKQALSKRKETETLGDALLNLGFITRKELSWARRIQVINVIRSIEEWSTGSFMIVADYLPKREEGTIFSLPQLIVEMIVTDQDRGKFEQALESGAVVFQKAAGQDETFRSLGLNEDAEAVMEQVDGERSAAEVAAASRQETFNAFKLLHALSLLGVLERKRPAAPAAASGFESAGVSDAADAWGAPDAQFEFLDEAAPPPPAPPSYEIPEEQEAPAVPPSRPIPGWDAAPRGASPVVAPSPEPPAEAAEEPRWGFDEAQLEAARGTTPAVPPPPAGRKVGTPAPAAGGAMSRRPASKPVQRRAPRRFGVLLTLLALVAVGAIGFFGFSWWTSRQAREAPQALAPTAAATRPAMQAPATDTTPAPPPAPTETAAATTTPPAPPSAAPPAAAAGSSRERYEAMARQYAANPTGNFTVQFAIVCDPANVTKALRGSGGEDVWFIPISLQGRSCFRLFWGRFNTRAEAEQGLTRLPGEFRESRAAVVTIPR